ncbi:MAG: hypothetical protein GF401_04180 [Chitinivibrionales bacterium]|nr:hypothetical protein [Chitinivibrionales bacterium]
MLIHSFILITAIIDIVFCFMLLFKKKRKLSVVPSFILTLLISETSWVANRIVSSTIGIIESDWIKFYGALSMAATIVILELVHQLVPLRRKGKHIVSPWIWRVAGILTVGISLFTQWTHFIIQGDTPTIRLNAVGMGIIILHFLLNLLVLYFIETAYRSLEPYRRRGITTCFIAFAGIAGYQMIFHTNTLLFQTISTKYMLAGIVVNSLLLPIAFSGMFRHRIANEKVAVSREIIYSSLSLFIAGAVLLGLGSTVYIISRFGIAFTQFEIFFGIFSAAFLVVFVVTSPKMRGTIVRFAGKHIYQRKYDYRDQFFRLHQTYMTATTMEESIMQLIIALKYGAGFEDAYIFLADPRDDNFYLQNNPVSPVKGPEIGIPGSSVMISTFTSDTKPLDFLTLLSEKPGTLSDNDRRIIERLQLTALFPVIHNKALLGVLGIRTALKEALDKEDKMLIRVFAGSIGNVIYKYKLQREHVENKQFESFSRISSFIIHDVKNQVATLSLVAKNADKNMDNPEFRKSLLRSIKNCSANLQVLINKLGSAPKQDDLEVTEQDISPVIMEALESSGVDAVADVDISTDISTPLLCRIDKKSLFYIMKNLIINALEAMEFKGTLSLYATKSYSIPPSIKQDLALGDHLIARHHGAIIVKDTGCGMSQEFMQNKLFHPFSSTKDKGVGIGLYQCRTLVEKMHGRLLCSSRMGEGSVFCILM